MSDKKVLYQSQYLQLGQRAHWEFVERTQAYGVVIIIAVTPDKRLILVEQYRPAVNRRVLELPAGLVGDHQDHAKESFIDAAQRELLEETGYEAKTWIPWVEGPPSPGISNEIVTFFRAEDIKKVGPGGGVESEQITVHEVPLASIDDFILDFQQHKGLVAIQVFAGLYQLAVPTHTGT